MTATEPDLPHPPEQWVDERGVTLTREGVVRARQRLVELDAYWTPERRAVAHAAFAARLGSGVPG